MELFTQFKAMQKHQKAYQYVLAIAGWDANTEAPKASFPYRAEMLGMISGEHFSLATSEAYQAVVNELMKTIDTLDTQDALEVRRAKKTLDKIINIPKDEYVEYAKLMNLSQRVWEDAKATDDYEAFKPYLKKIIDAKKRHIAYRTDRKDMYNVLLDDFEEGMDMAQYDAFFDTLKKDLVPFVKAVLTKKRAVEPFAVATYPRDGQKRFIEYLMNVFHYDQNRGLVKESVHPFTWSTHTQDVRFTVRYIEDQLFSSIFAGAHELGHAIYDLNFDPALDDTNLNQGASHGIHESQSRFYENIVARSKPFWVANLEALKNEFPTQLQGVDVERFYRAINAVDETYIRVEADELTYPLHILLRYEIERDIFEGNLDVDALPEVWNQKMKQYLNLTPQKMSVGVLQDVHWSAGMFGYFPTYALGSAYAAQIYATMKQDLDVDALLKNNDIQMINAWLQEKIHRHGATKKPLELLEMVTGESFNPSYYVDYLKAKYSALY